MLMLSLSVSFGLLAGNVLQLPEGRDFYHKTVFGTRNPAFWVGAVIASAFFLRHYFVALNDFTTKYIKGIKISPNVIGKNQIPSPSACPFAF